MDAYAFGTPLVLFPFITRKVKLTVSLLSNYTTGCVIVDAVLGGHISVTLQGMIMNRHIYVNHAMKPGPFKGLF